MDKNINIDSIILPNKKKHKNTKVIQHIKSKDHELFNAIRRSHALPYLKPQNYRNSFTFIYPCFEMRQKIIYYSFCNFEMSRYLIKSLIIPEFLFINNFNKNINIINILNQKLKMSNPFNIGGFAKLASGIIGGNVEIVEARATVDEGGLYDSAHAMNEALKKNAIANYDKDSKLTDITENLLSYMKFMYDPEKKEISPVDKERAERYFDPINGVFRCMCDDPVVAHSIVIGNDLIDSKDFDAWSETPMKYKFIGDEPGVSDDYAKLKAAQAAQYYKKGGIKDSGLAIQKELTAWRNSLLQTPDFEKLREVVCAVYAQSENQSFQNAWADIMSIYGMILWSDVSSKHDLSIYFHNMENIWEPAKTEDDLNKLPGMSEGTKRESLLLLQFIRSNICSQPSHPNNVSAMGPGDVAPFDASDNVNTAPFSAQKLAVGGNCQTTAVTGGMLVAGGYYKK
jgi:hypothetical protein